MKEEKIVILGGGFAGISAKLYYPKAILVDKSNEFYLTPRYIELLESSVDLSSVRIPRSVDILAEVKSINFKRKEVITTAGEIKYDKLIITLGYSQEVSRIKGAERYALKYETLDDVLYLKDRLRSAKSVAILGGGPLGVELAGSIRDKQVFIIEAEERILPMFSEEVSSYAMKLLAEKYKVEIYTKTLVEEISEGRVITSNGMIKADLVVFAAGFMGNNIISKLEISNKKNRILVDKTLRSVDYDDVFVAGDCAIFKDSFIPQSAQVAQQAGEVAMKNALGGEVEFKPKQRAIIVRVGEDYFGILEGKFVRGALAKFLKRIALSLVEGKVRKINEVIIHQLKTVKI